MAESEREKFLKTTPPPSNVIGLALSQSVEVTWRLWSKALLPNYDQVQPATRIGAMLSFDQASVHH